MKNIIENCIKEFEEKNPNYIGECLPINDNDFHIGYFIRIEDTTTNFANSYMISTFEIQTSVIMPHLLFLTILENLKYDIESAKIGRKQ